MGMRLSTEIHEVVVGVEALKFCGKMVSFICNACGQTVRKAQVEKHYQNDCHNCDVLSCIDCGKDFHGDEYTSHTSCITEAEKYQGKLYKPRDKQNKGEHKQQEWLKQVREATKSGAVDPRLAGLLDRISEYSNIPRKKAKFQNFCRNSINVRDSATLDRLWEAFSSSSKQSSQQGEVNGSDAHDNGQINATFLHEDNLDDQDEHSERTESKLKELVQKSNKKENKETRDSKKHRNLGEQLKDSDMSENEQKSKAKKTKHNMNGNTEEVDGLEKNKKKRKRKRREDGEEGDVPYTHPKLLKAENEESKERCTYHFKWKSVIKAVLREAPDCELPMKRLRKKVLAEFQAQGANGKNLTDNELRALFEKKVTNNPKFKVHKDRVRLVK